MNSWINYHHLNYFRVIATEGSIARAAEKLRLGQPTLSAQLKLFEDTIGATLFDRQHKKLTLTEAGRVTLNYANEIFRLGDELLEVLKDNSSLKKTHLQIAALDSVPKTLVMALAKAAYKIQPCTVSIIEGKGDELMTELAEHKVDLLITNFIPSVKGKNRVLTRSVAQLPVAVWGTEKFKNLKKNFPRSLEGAPFILPTNHSKMRLDLERFFKLSGIQVEPVAETQDTSLQKLMGANHIGLVPATAVAIQNPLLLKLGVIPGVFEEYFLVTAERKIENPISAQLMKGFKL